MTAHRQAFQQAPSPLLSDYDPSFEALGAKEKGQESSTSVSGEQIENEFIPPGSGAADVQPLSLAVAWHLSLLAAALCDPKSEITLARGKSVRYQVCRSRSINALKPPNSEIHRTVLYQIIFIYQMLKSELTTNQGVGSSNLSGRAIKSNLRDAQCSVGLFATKMLPRAAMITSATFSPASSICCGRASA